MRSFAVTYGPNRPWNSKRKVSGTRNQTFPVAMAPARSVDPTPVAKAPTAPYVHVCESAPTTTSPVPTNPAPEAGRAPPRRARCRSNAQYRVRAVSYTHLRAHETDSYLVCRLLL